MTNTNTDTDTDTTEAFIPPPTAPPFLSPPAVAHLCQQGWLRISLPAHLTSTLYQLHAQTSDFFNQATEHKQRLYPAKQGTEFGYYHIAGEKEYLTLRCRQSSSHSPPPARPESPEQQQTPHSANTKAKHTDRDRDLGLDTAAATLWIQTTTLLTRILHDISRHLNLPPGIWDDLIAGTSPMPLCEADIHSGTLLRLFRYAPRGGQGAGEHTDLGLLTLCVGGRGLELFDWAGEGRYVDVMDVSHSSQDGVGGVGGGGSGGSEQGAVVLVGQTLRGLTGGLLNAGVHRVVETGTGRESVVFALRHGWEKAEVDLAPWGGMGTVKARDLYRWLGIGVVNVNAGAEVRERQRGVLLERMGRGNT